MSNFSFIRFDPHQVAVDAGGILRVGQQTTLPGFRPPWTIRMTSMS